MDQSLSTVIQGAAPTIAVIVGIVRNEALIGRVKARIGGIENRITGLDNSLSARISSIENRLDFRMEALQRDLCEWLKTMNRPNVP
jgi:hypothetical protein